MIDVLALSTHPPPARRQGNPASAGNTMPHLALIIALTMAASAQAQACVPKVMGGSGISE
jgi:hypothetical protein